MKSIKFIVSVSALLFFITSCEKNDSSPSCGEDAIVSPDAFKSEPKTDYNIDQLSIDDDCLTIAFNAGGCDGKSWVLKLIDSDDVLESHPPQRVVRLSIKNDEICAAVVNEEVSFDIKALQVMDGNSVILRFTEDQSTILYEY